jgi:F-type H+-transporting ATPase subunit epsilon
VAITQVGIVTPLRQIKLEKVSYLRAPSVDGLFGVKPRHAHAVFALDLGEVAVEIEGKKQYYAIGGGYAEVFGDHIIMIVQSAERADEINLERAEKAAQRAKERLAKHTDPNEGIDADRAEIALKRAINRITIARKNTN